VERQCDPALADRPVVIGGRADGPGRVVAASVEAMASGVHPGLSIPEARRRCPGAAFLPGHFERALDATARIDEVLRQAHRLAEWLAADEAVASLGPLDRRRSGAVAEEVCARVREAGFSAACGVAGSRAVARVAARLARPSGILVVLPGYEGRFLAPLDLACLDDLPDDVRERLSAAGIATIGALAATSASRATELVGSRGAALVTLAAGLDPRPVRPPELPRRLCRHVCFATPESSAVTLGSAIDGLVDAVGTGLRAHGWLARSLMLRLDHAGGRCTLRAAPLPQPAARPEALRLATRRLWATAAVTAPPAIAISVAATQLSRAAAQPSLFSSGAATGTDGAVHPDW
jgi:DNA polymerase-4